MIRIGSLCCLALASMLAGGCAASSGADSDFAGQGGGADASGTGGSTAYDAGAGDALTLDVNTSCTPKTCKDLGANCGTVADSCGQFIECGQCTGGQTCGA